MTILANIHFWVLFYRLRLLAAVLLLILFAGAGASVWLARKSSVGPAPPGVPSDLNETEARALLERMRARLIKEPRSASAWGILGQAFLANELENESQVCFAEAERLDSRNPRWPHYQAVVLLTQGKQQAALPYLHRAVERAAIADPDIPISRLLLAEDLLTIGQIDQAEDHFRQVLARHPDEPRAHLGMALAAFARQDWQSSRSHLLRCLDSPAARQKASAQLEAVCLQLGQPEEAENYRRQAERLPPDTKWNDPFVKECEGWIVIKSGLYRQAAILESAGKLREAANVLQPIVEKYPDDYRARLSLGRVLGQLGEHPRATLLLCDVCRLEPDNVQAHYYLSLTLFEQAEKLRQQESDAKEAEKLYQDAAEYARRALAIKKDYGYAHVTLGLSLRRLGRHADAMAAFREAVHCNPELAEAHYFLGEMLADKGDPDEARKQLEQALALAPPNTSWRQEAAAHLAALAPNNRAK
jgi:tetratricopeptide (TPR) repeat protein